MKHEDDSDTNCRWHAWNSSQRFEKKACKNLKSQKERDHPDHSIAKIGSNSPRDQRKLAVSQISVKEY